MANIFKGVTVDHAEAHNEQISVGVGQPWIAKAQKNAIFPVVEVVKGTKK